MGQVLGPHSKLFPFPAESPFFSLIITFSGRRMPTDIPRRRQVTVDFLFGGSLFRNPDACIAALWNVMEGYGVTGLLFYTTRLARTSTGTSGCGYAGGII